MNKIIYLLGIVTLITTYSCSSTYQAGNNKTDDVYYSSKNQPQSSSTTPDNYQNNSDNYQNSNSGNTQQPDYVPNNDNSTYSQSTDGKGNTYITNNYNGDYYDYEYSSRIRRFYNPAYGYNYYDPFYTNSYWYDYNPSSWGVSIYLGYNWWAPSTFYYDPFCYGGFSIGYNYNPYWGYNPYGYGGYGSSFYNGYNQGYWNGFHDGYYGGNPNPYYYNSYDATSFYYGPRGAVSSNSPRFSSQRQSNIAPMSAKYEQAISDGRVSRAPINDMSKSDIITRDRYNSDKENKLPKLTKDQNIRNQTGTEKINSDQRSNSEIRNNSTTSKPSINQYRNPVNNSQNKNKNIQEQDFGGNRNSKDRIFNSPNPEVNPNTGRSNQNTQDHNRNLQENNQNKKENQRTIFGNPKIDQTPKQEDHYQRKMDSRIEMPSRQENKTPVFTPRDQPKQYKQENAPSPQRVQPAEHNNNGGRRK